MAGMGGKRPSAISLASGRSAVISSSMGRLIARNVGLFLLFWTALFYLGKIGRIDGFGWGIIATLMYFPASISLGPIEIRLEALTEGVHFIVLGYSISARSLFSYLANGLVGAIWWASVTAIFVYVNERNYPGGYY